MTTPDHPSPYGTPAPYGPPPAGEPDPYSYHSPYWVPPTYSDAQTQPFHPQGAPLPFTPPSPPRRRKGLLSGAGLIAAGAAVGVVAATSLHIGSDSTTTAQSTPTIQTPSTQTPTTQTPTTQTPTTQTPTTQTPGQFPFPTGGSQRQSSAATASATQQKGVVVINTVLGYQSASAAGTGMVLTSNGEVLTNNHVVEGATRITVTISSTGKKYTATVVGTDPTDDVAVIKLSGASGLTVANIDTTPTPAVGDKVTAVGNAGGTGTLTAASGSVTALEQSITASDENGANAERLKGLIETDAAVVAGDSGGPLYDSSGQIIGIDTAAATGRAGTTAGYAIPIDDALSIASQIESGRETSKIHIGTPGLLGVSVVSATNGAGVESVVAGSAAARAGIVAGDVITAMNGKTIATANALSTFVKTTSAGQRVTVTWRTAAGASRTATVTLGNGPAD